MAKFKLSFHHGLALTVDSSQVSLSDVPVSCSNSGQVVHTKECPCHQAV